MNRNLKLAGKISELLWIFSTQELMAEFFNSLFHDGAPKAN